MKHLNTIKKIITIIVMILVITKIAAQNPDPGLEGTWVLDLVFTNGLITTPPTNDEIDQVILSIQFDFLSTIACDEIETSIATINDTNFIIDTFSVNSNSCALPETLDFQNVYFNEFFTKDSPGTQFFYFIQEDGNGVTNLILENLSNERAEYTKAPLSTVTFSQVPITIYPNPTNGNLTITSNNSRIEIISIYNLQGQEVLTLKFQQNEPTIDTSNLQAGVYFLQAESDTGQQFTAKFVKQK